MTWYFIFVLKQHEPFHILIVFHRAFQSSHIKYDHARKHETKEKS